MTHSLKLSTTAQLHQTPPIATDVNHPQLTPSLYKATVLCQATTMLSPSTACEAAYCTGKSNRTPKLKGHFPVVPAQLPWVLSSHQMIQNYPTPESSFPGQACQPHFKEAPQPHSLAGKDKRPGGCLFKTPERSPALQLSPLPAKALESFTVGQKRKAP